MDTKQFYQGPERFNLLSVLKEGDDYSLLVFNSSIKKLHKVSYKKKAVVSTLDYSYYTTKSLSADGSILLTQYNKEVILFDLRSMTKKSVLNALVKSIHWSHKENSFIVELNKSYTQYTYKVTKKGEYTLYERRQKNDNYEYLKPIISPNYEPSKLGVKISDTLYYDSGYYLIYDKVYNRPVYAMKNTHNNEEFLDCRLLNDEAVFLTLRNIIRVPVDKLIKL